MATIHLSRWNVSSVLAIVSIVVATGLGLAAGPAGARDVKLGHLAPTADPRHEVLTKFAETIKTGTNGAITVQLFPNSTLGSERELFEQAQAGVTELALVGGIVSNFYPAWAITDMPYLWKNEAHLQKFMSSDVARKWSGEMSQKLGVELLAFLERNPRILVTREKPVNTMSDLKGMKIRVPNIKVYTDAWRAFGVEPVPMPASDFYMGLRLGTIDGMENPVEVMYHWKAYEVGKYLSLTNHMYSGFFLVASKKFMDSLTEDQRKVIRAAALDAQTALAKANAEGARTLYDKLRAAGMTIIEKPDVSGFVAASKSVHEKSLPQFGKEAYDLAVKLGN
jgi:tripartite ATP-independent transporter DctP family solute receptor